MTALTSGKAAEDAALAYLESQGLVLVARNYRCRSGEIDLIMKDGKHLVFAEVRFRRSQRYGGAIESIDAAKRTRIITAASHYLVSTRVDCPARFDVVAMSPGPDRFAVTWIRNAFDLS